MTESPNIQSAKLQSPCTKVCTLDARTRLCLGCGRTIDEIAGWSTMSPAARARVMDELPARLANIHPAQAAGTAG